jgi:hypothetical protein
MTLAMVWTLLKNRYVQYVLIGIGVFFLLLAVRQHYINIGKDAGRQEVSSSPRTCSRTHARPIEQQLRRCSPTVLPR